MHSLRSLRHYIRWFRQYICHILLPHHCWHSFRSSHFLYFYRRFRRHNCSRSHNWHLLSPALRRPHGSRHGIPLRFHLHTYRPECIRFSSCCSYLISYFVHSRWFLPHTVPSAGLSLFHCKKIPLPVRMHCFLYRSVPDPHILRSHQSSVRTTKYPWHLPYTESDRHCCLCGHWLSLQYLLFLRRNHSHVHYRRFLR